MKHSPSRHRSPSKFPHQYVAHHHFARQWAARNDEHVHVFANGHVYDKAARRKGLRSLIRVMRGERSRLGPL